MSSAEPEPTPTEPTQPGLLGGDLDPPADPGEPTAPDWLSSLPEDMRGEKSLQETKSVEALAKRFLDGQKLIGRKGVLAPKENDLSDFDRFVREAGFKPESRDDYKPEITVPKGMIADEKSLNLAVERAYEAGVHPGQLSAVMNAVLEAQHGAHQSLLESMQEKTAAARQTMQDEWGEQFDAKLNLALQTYHKVAEVSGLENPDAFRTLRLADGTQIGDRPEFARFFATIGERMSEQALMGSKEPARPQTPQEARSAMDEFLVKYGDEMKPDSASPRRQSLLEQFQTLVEAADPKGGEVIGIVEDPDG